MAGINTFVNDVVTGTGNFFDNIGGAVSSGYETAVGSVGAAWSSLANGDIVGINSASVPAMQAAIDAYISRINAHLESLNTNANTTNAFKGEYANAVKGFVLAVSNSCAAIISNLLVFKDRLNEVKAAYAKRDTTLSEEIGAQSSQLSSAFTPYTGEAAAPASAPASGGAAAPSSVPSSGPQQSMF